MTAKKVYIDRHLIHDLKQPLHVIKLCVENMRKKLENRNDFNERKFYLKKLEIIDKSITQLSNEMEGLLQVEEIQDSGSK